MLGSDHAGLQKRQTTVRENTAAVAEAGKGWGRASTTMTAREKLLWWWERLCLECCHLYWITYSCSSFIILHLKWVHFIV